MAKKNEIVEVVIELQAAIKDCPKVFKEGFDPGVVSTQEVVMKVPKDRLNGGIFAASVLEHQERFLAENFEVKIKQLKP